jgi:hypothetical protein
MLPIVAISPAQSASGAPQVAPDCNVPRVAQNINKWLAVQSHGSAQPISSISTISAQPGELVCKIQYTTARLRNQQVTGRVTIRQVSGGVKISMAPY